MKMPSIPKPPIAAWKTSWFSSRLQVITCLLYTSDAADERSSVDLGGRRIIKKKKKQQKDVDERDREQKQKHDADKGSP